eukprot:gene11688-15650_t
MNNTNLNSTDTSKSNSRYLDVITVRSSLGNHSHSSADKAKQSSHTKLLIEPVLLPDLDHIHLDKSATITNDSCLFYPNGEKSKSMRYEINCLVKDYLHHEPDEIVQRKEHIKINMNKKDKFSHCKNKYPLFYKKKSNGDSEKAMEDILKNMKYNEGKIIGTVNIRL